MIGYLSMAILILICFEGMASPDTTSLRRINLDSMSQSIQKHMESFDLTIKQMDEVMDSITGQSQPPLDALALLDYLQQQKKREMRQRNMLWVKVSLLVVVILLAPLLWRKRKKIISMKQN